MARTTKYTPNELAAELTLFSTAARDKYASDSYSAGYYESLLLDLIDHLSKAKQAEIITQVRITTAKLLG